MEGHKYEEVEMIDYNLDNYTIIKDIQDHTLTTYKGRIVTT